MNYRMIFIAGIFCVLISCNSSDKSDTKADTGRTEIGTAKPADSGQALQPAAQLIAAWQGMNRQLEAMTFSGNVDRDFAMLMKQHHMAAINLSRVEVSVGNNREMKEMADKIVSVQQGEVGEFDQILMKLPASGNSKFGKQALAVIRRTDQLKIDSSSVDITYSNLMTAHHTDAIRIARDYLQQGKHAGLKEIAARMIKEQQKDINAMKEWQMAISKQNSMK
ncbi:MAG TPA: DUF305 domain-containing protein [Chitinophagaceae bacterium]